MKPGIFPVDVDAVGEGAVSDGCKEAVADIFIVHPEKSGGTDNHGQR